MKYDLETIRRRGYEYIIPGRKKEWDDLCDHHIHSADLSLLNQVVDIMEKLNSNAVSYETITEEAEKEIAHSGASWGWTVKNVAYFNEHGVNYALNGANLFITENARNQLLEMQEENKKLMTQQNGNDLETIRRRGYEYIIPGRKKEWDDLCDHHIHSADLSLLNQVVDIMEKLNSKEVSYEAITEDAEKEISHSGASWGWTVKNVAYYHERGVDYALNGANLFITENAKNQLLEIQEENKKLMNKPKR